MSIEQIVVQASDTHKIDSDLINIVIKAESGFNIRAVSPKGAQGLMQLMPVTASNLGIPNPFDPKANVDGGTRYLRFLLEKYNYDLVKALAAYNAGPEQVDRYHGVPPYYETQAYVARIVRDYNRKKLAEQKAAKMRASRPATTTASRDGPICTSKAIESALSCVQNQYSFSGAAARLPGQVTYAGRKEAGLHGKQ